MPLLSPIPLRLVVPALGFGLAVLTGMGCPTAGCNKCHLKAGEFNVSDCPRDATIVAVDLKATGTFTGHCPVDERKECEETEIFSSSPTEGAHHVDLDGWEFDSNDGFLGEVIVTLNPPGGTCTISPVTLVDS